MKTEITLLPFSTPQPTIFISYMVRFSIIKVYCIYLLLGSVHPHGFIIVMGI